MSTAARMLLREMNEAGIEQREGLIDRTEAREERDGVGDQTRPTSSSSALITGYTSHDEAEATRRPI